MSRSRIHLIVIVALLSALALSIPSESTQAVGSGSAGQDSQKHNAGAEAYKKLLPELAAAHRKKLDQQLARLKQQADELSPRILEAQKKTGLDLNSVVKEMRSAASIGDANQAAQAQSKIFSTYEPQLSKLLQVAAINPQREIERLMTAVSLRDARPVDSSFIAAGGMDESKREEPPASTPPPDVKMEIFTAPFTSDGRIGGDVVAQASTGRLALANQIHIAGSSQKLGFITQDLFVERGMRRIRVFARFDPTTYGTFANALLGYSSAEAIVNLRLLEGSTVIASDRLSLSRSIAAVIGSDHREGARPLTLQFDYTRPAPDDETTYTLVAEVEGWAGAGGLSDAITYVNATVRQFQVYLRFALDRVYSQEQLRMIIACLATNERLCLSDVVPGCNPNRRFLGGS